MAVVNFPISDEDKSLGITGECTMCGKPSAAHWWSSGGVIEVCTSCATDKLPLLIADAIPDSLVESDKHAHSIVKSIVGAFWRGLSIRLMQRFKKPTQSVEELEHSI
jgi:hypothetical protein